MSTDKGNPIVVKVGGSLIDQSEAVAGLWPGLRTLREEAPVVLVHGGGKQMTALADRLGHTPTKVQGRRITTDLDLKIVQWALCGTLNTQLVAQAQQHGLTAVGLTGADVALVQVSKRPAWEVDGETVDFGWVGDVEQIDPSLLEDLLARALTPVVAPLGIDQEGQVYNVNADTVACAVAEALAAQRLLFVTGTGGVRRTADDPASRLDTCDWATFERGVEDGWIEGGMRVKVETALEALDGPVDQAYICGVDDLQGSQGGTEVIL